MAVSVQAPFYSKSGMWNLGDPPTAYTSTGSEAISTSMAYQYPLATSALESSNMIPSFPHPLDHTQPLSPTHGQPLSPSIKNIGSSTSYKSAKVKRSMSTPNVRGQATAEAAALALSADKRRNKLGYHRTSVACGHCRRRKIRCIPAPADPQSRCSNCIRLKKECNFYPVDQQPQPDPRRRGSKTQSGTGPSETSSPTTSSGQLPEISSSLPYPPLSMPPIQDLGGPHMKRQRTESFSPENRGVKSLNTRINHVPDKVAVVTSTRNFDYNHGTTNWMASDASPSIKHQGEMSQAYWRHNPQDSPLTPAFSPFTPNLQIPPPQNWSTPHPEPSPREDLNWSVPPQRSISYSNLEGLQNQHQYGPYSAASSNSATEHYTTKPRPQQHTGMYPPPLTTPNSTVTAPTSSAGPNENVHHPHSAGPLPPTTYQTWQQPYSYQKPASSNGEGYGAWSAPHEGLPRPTAFPGEPHGPPHNYGYPEPAGVYYPAPPHPGR